MRKFCGLALVTVILASMVLVALPVSAGTLELSTEAIPDTSDGKLVPTAGTSILDIAVASDGATIYAAMGTGGAAASQKLYKSADGGFTWQAVTTPNNAAADAVNLVAVAPDDSNIIAILGDISPATGNDAGYVSMDGGITFDNLNIPSGTWYDVTISASTGDTRYIGISGTVAGVASFLYFDLGTAAPVWTDAVSWAGGGFAPAATSIRTAAFSPNFAADETFVAVSEEANTAGGARFHIANINVQKWDTAGGFTGYPVTLTAFTVAGINVASIALDPAYWGSDDSSRLAFVGASMTQAVTGKEIGGTWRLTDTDVLPLNIFTGIKSVAWNGGSLVAGATASNSVYYFEDLATASPTISTTPALKRPSGTGNVIVAWAGPNVVAATTGSESAFSISRDDAKSFNAVGLINTTLTTLEDICVADDAAKTYLVTDNGSDLSLWRKTDTWERVLALPGDTGYLVRIAPEDKDTVYLAKSGGTEIYFTKDGGEHNWSPRRAPGDIQDLAVESADVADVAYVAISNTASVVKSTNGGFTWNTPVATSFSGNIRSLVSLGTNKLAAGSTTGYVAYSTDGNSTWTAISTPLHAGAGNVQVTASGLASSDFIYATEDGASTGVWRWQIGQSDTGWKDMSAPVTTNFGAYGIGLRNGALWVVVKDRTAVHSSQILRSLNPSSSETVEWSNVSDTGQDFNDVPEAFVLTSDGRSGTIIWLIDTFTQQLYRFTDPLSGMAPYPNAPGNGFSNPVNSTSGRPGDMVFTWPKPAQNTTAYEIGIYADDAASIQLTAATVNSTDDTVAVLLGPYQTGTRHIEFTPGTTYYWRVRAISPVTSPWSTIFRFTVEPEQALVPGLLSPANGASGVNLTPAFSWSPVAGAGEYRFIMATNPELTSPIVDSVTDGTAYAVSTDLEYGQTYYWAVKSLEPVEGNWSTIANFTVKPQPVEAAPPVVVQKVPPPVINIPVPPPSPEIVVLPPQPPEQVRPPYIWAIIIIGTMLIIAVIILIFRTRRPV